jgi:hypothetical protein
MACKNPCRLLHPSCIHILRWSLKHSVTRTWTGSLRGFHQRGCLKWSGHGLSVSWVRWPLVYNVKQHEQLGTEIWFEWLDDEAEPSRSRAYNCVKGPLHLTDRSWQQIYTYILSYLHRPDLVAVSLPLHLVLDDISEPGDIDSQIRASSHGSQVLSPKSLEANPCNLCRRGSMEVGTCHFTRGSKP